MANFTPNQNDYKDLTPFKSWLLLQINTWGQNNFPFVESDFDELTNYGMMQKLMKAVNDVISNENLVEEDMTNIFNAFTELQNYVNQYFDNLDVQDEINVKLDELVEDGTLTNLISTYLQPYIDEQNANIDNFESEVNESIDDFERRLSSATSGSPLVASSTSGMTNTSRIYVNTSDGKWYYYNGSAWVAGGTYQSTELEDGSVTYNTLDDSLKQDLNSVVSTTEYLPIADKYIEDNGHVLDNTNGGFYCYSIPVEPFETYIIDIQFESYRYGNNTPLYAFRNETNNLLISKLSKADATNNGTLVNNHFHVEISAPYNAEYLNINTSGNNLRNYIVKVSKYQTENISKEQLDEKLQTIFEDVYEEVEPTLFVDGGYIEGLSTTQSIAGYSIYYYDVNPGEKYSLSVKQFYNNPYLVYTTNNSTRVETFNGGTYTMNQFMKQEKNTSTGTIDIVDFEFVVPEYCERIYINKMNTSPLFSLKKSTSYLIKIDDIDLEYIKNENNPLNNKKIMFTGDSITAATTSGVKGYTGIIAENNPPATIYNYGVDGATISVEESQPTKNVVTYIQNMYSEHPDADYIIIQGGVNDFFKLLPLGTFNEHANFNGETPYDTSTFSGALEWVFHYALTHFGGKKIGYIVTQKVNSGPNFYQFMNRAKEICKKWAIPYVDLYESSDLNFAITQQKENYSITTTNPNGDGLHPNLAGYQIITAKIENWLKYII